MSLMTITKLIIVQLTQLTDSGLPCLAERSLCRPIECCLIRRTSHQNLLLTFDVINCLALFI